ncbi:hypothetical protein [Nonomuraea fuscirosea]|uniref:hypothetical protein n=1 Tax=Nonomuraea fuscirosea TaxID=1291556 RepID=UPI0033F2ED77
MTIKQWTSKDLEEVRRQVIAGVETGLPTGVTEDAVLALFEALDQQRIQTDQMRGALAVIRDAIDLPYAATAADAEVRGELLDIRAALARQTLRRLLGEAEHLDIALEVGLLRESLAEHLPNCLTDVQAHAARASGQAREEPVTRPWPKSPSVADPPRHGALT